MRKDLSLSLSVSLHLKCKGCLRSKGTLGSPLQLGDLAKPLKEASEKHPWLLVSAPQIYREEQACCP